MEALVFSVGYERLPRSAVQPPRCDAAATSGFAWVCGSAEAACLDTYDKAIGLDLANLAVDGCTTKAPCGGECAGRSPVGRAKAGMKRSELTDDASVPIATVSAAANSVDHALLAETQLELANSSEGSVRPCCV